jgi:uncharacterized protein YecE (DUF72 family)
LEFYSERFRSVEVNYSFYRLPLKTTYEKWADQSPDGFLFTLKLSRFITHVKRLHGVKTAFRTFITRAAPLGAKLGPVLVQLPPTFGIDVGRLERFLKGACEVGGERGINPLRLAFEFRHPTWFGPDATAALDTLKRYGAAFVCAHSNRYPYPDTEPVTGDFMYLRFHGPVKMFESEYGRSGLSRWALLIDKWRGKGIDVFAYFNNDVSGHAVRDAQALLELVEA